MFLLASDIIINVIEIIITYFLQGPNMRILCFYKAEADPWYLFAFMNTMSSVLNSSDKE